VVLPVIPGSGVAPELLVLATTAGSLMFSHFNDIGFWMFKEYYNVTVKQTFQIWTVMESIVAIVGLVGAIALSYVVPSPAAAAQSAQKKVFYVNSYHEGYGSSDDVMSGLRETLQARGVALDIVFLDSKRRPEREGIEQRATEAAERIRRVKPDVLVVSDDDAVKYLVVPYFKNGPIPVVFCGVNWDASQYGLPNEWVTGMLEVVPIEATLKEAMRGRAEAKRLLVLSEDSTSERNNRVLLDDKYRGLGLTPSYSMVADFETWKEEFVRAQKDADVIYLPTNGAVRGWNDQVAREWVGKYTRVPAVTCDDFMMPYVAFGLTKVAKEQGEWAAQAALRILEGAKPGAIAMTRNERTRCYWNPELAKKARLTLEARRDCEAVR
jgi:ABC-type uncharacterized transport system substrate-binding protein